MNRFSLVVTAAVVTAAVVVAAPPAPVTALAYRTDGSLLAAGSRGTVVLIDPTTGEAIGELTGQTQRVTALAFSHGGLLAVASGEPGISGLIGLYDATTPTVGKPLASIAAHKDIIYALAFSPDGKTLASAGYDRTIKLWDVTTATTPNLRQTLTDHSDAVYALAWNPKGTLLASGAADRAVKVWDVSTGKRLYTLSDPTDWVYTVAWNPAGTHLTAGGADKSIRTWEAGAKGGKLIRSAFAHDRAVTRLVYAPDGATLYSVGEDRVVKAWDAAKLTEVKVFPAQPDQVLAVALRPDGKQLALGGFDGSVVLFDTASGTAKPLSLTKAANAPRRRPNTAPPKQPESPPKPTRPEIKSLSPNSAPRGTTTRVTFTGTNFGASPKVRSEPAGLTVKPVPAGHAPTQFAADVTIPEQTQPGPFELVVTSDSGESNKARFWVDRFPSTATVGRADSVHSAMVVTTPVTIAGTLDRAGDVDYFRFTATVGQEIGVQVQPSDKAKLDPVVTLTDGSGHVMAEGANGALGYVCPTPGAYVLSVRDREYRGGAALAYRMHVGPTPVVTGVFPLGVARGVETLVNVRGVNLGRVGGLDVRVKPTADAAIGSKLRVPLAIKGDEPVGATEVTVGEFHSVNISADGRATLPAVPGTADGVLAKPGEAHTIRFAAKKGHALIVETQAARLGSPVDSFVEILDATGKPISRATLRCTTKTFTTFRDNDSNTSGIRLEYWNELAMDDLLYVGGELTRIRELPKGPDDDCQFYAEDGKRLGFLGTTPTFHYLGSSMYKVEVHPPGSVFPPNGMPVFSLYYRNDDGGPGYGKDSAIFFDPPADGDYLARVSDSSGVGGPAHAYRLTVRPPRPDFTVKFTPTAPKVWKGGAVPVTITASRLDGFEGPIRVQFEGLPAPLHAPSTIIDARQQTTAVALAADAGAVSGAGTPLRLVARATIGGREVIREATGSTPTLAEPGDLVTTVSSSELTIRPGTESRLTVRVERRDGHAGRVPLDVRGLPHGVRVLNIGLNGILILPGATEREIVVYAEPWVKPTDRPFVVLARSERKGTEHAAPAVVLKVRQ
ncbi:WD40 repeat domain-containing protein [Fimbriiglobus ruber]|uniref:High-affnity carbon uptake protein Hat/HatR n=1 Tax=Fimbriiglobus ruber TaxID=1908690 RepID=A0A225EEX0_9BACT|nr:WD40 repeat domain-containing protein [Fimbriiglobus ruber]OWK46905.1 High-affnity carbon uptake protein Hat/HatR [Fimbriiglobus ruber]